jgi:hypothetical protein
MVNIGRAEGRAAGALYGRGVGGQHADAKAVAGAGADFAALEFQRRGEGRVSSHAKAGRQAQLSNQARPLRPSVVLGSKDSSRASA